MELYRDGYTDLLVAVFPEYNQRLIEDKDVRNLSKKLERRRVSEVNRGGPIPSFKNVSLENKWGSLSYGSGWSEEGSRKD